MCAALRARAQVWKGLLRDGDNPAVPEYIVAVKTVKQADGNINTHAAAAAEEELLKEALLMSQVNCVALPAHKPCFRPPQHTHARVVVVVRFHYTGAPG